MDVISSEVATSYPLLFQHYVIRTAQRSLEEVTANTTTPHSKLEQALHILTLAVNLANGWSTVRNLSFALAPIMEQAGYRDELIQILEKAILQSRTMKDICAEAQFHLHLGHLYQLRARYELGILHLQASFELFTKVNDQPKMAEVLNRWAYIARLQGDLEQANTLVQQAMALLSVDDTQLAFCHFVLGTIANDRRNWGKAIEEIQHSLTIYTNADDKRMMALRLGNLGPPLFMSQQYLEAISCYEQAIALFGQMHDPVQKAVMQMNLGNVYSVLKQPRRAIELYTAAIPVLNRVHDELHLAMLDTNMGIAHRQCKDFKQSERLLLAAIERWRLLENIRSQANAYVELGVTYLEQEQFAVAKGAFLCARNLLTQNESIPGHVSLLDSINHYLCALR